MVDHYKVLGVPHSVSLQEIKTAFKKLAVKYHPDKNPGNKSAEEYFKEINRAYQILSDPYKRHQYDLILRYQRTQPPPPTRSIYRPFYYPPYAKNARYTRKEYQYGWDYVKAQVAAFAFIFLVAALVMGVKYLYDNYKVGESIRLAEAREVLFQEAQRYFDEGEYRKSLDIIVLMQKKNPIERSIRDYRDKFIGEVLLMADSQLIHNNYESAIINFSIVRDYQRFGAPVIYRKLAECYTALEMYQETANALEAILADDDDNIKLNLEIGNIYLVKLNQPERSKPYLDRARVELKKVLTEVYGRAAELVMNPKETPLFYFDVFFTHAKVSSLLNEHEDAIKDCNWSAFLRPDLPEPFYVRGNSYLALGNTYKACKNWTQAMSLQHQPSIEMLAQYCN